MAVIYHTACIPSRLYAFVSYRKSKKLWGIVPASFKTERDCIVVCGAQLGKLTANFERRFQLEQDGLLKEDLARLQAESPHLGLGHLYRLPGAGAANYE